MAKWWRWLWEETPAAGLIESATADGVMLVGDAAHQTDPLTGGGILNAMQAGIIAGEVAAKALAVGQCQPGRIEGI